MSGHTGGEAVPEDGARGAPPRAPAERVLCVPQEAISSLSGGRGLVTSRLVDVLDVIATRSSYHDRGCVEDDPRQRQIVPYCVVHHRHDGTYLLTRRRDRSGEPRLRHRCSLGIGGHVNPGDGVRGDAVVGGLVREWREEVVCPAPATARLIAIVDDASSPVSRVHLGLVFIVEPLGCTVHVREHDKLEGRSLPLQAVGGLYGDLETWSQLVVDHLVGMTDPAVIPAAMCVDLAPAP